MSSRRKLLVRGRGEPEPVSGTSRTSPRARLRAPSAGAGVVTLKGGHVERAVQKALKGHPVIMEPARADGASGPSSVAPRSVGPRSKRVDHTTEVMERLESLPEGSAGQTGVVRNMPRRKFASAVHASVAAPPVAHTVKLHATNGEALRRSFSWIGALLLFALGGLVDKILRRDTIDRRAARMLATFQRVGGTLVKIGQQLSMRLDMLPYAYCRELMKLLDSVKPFKTEYAIRAVERVTGRPLGEVFSTFDPVPIGSASIGCVYQAVLRSGEKVAVKVRRPGIEKVFAADLKVIRWLITLAEWMTLIRAGQMTNFVREFEGTFSEELDFRLETYYQDYFRRHATKKKHTARPHYFTAPKVYFEWSGNDVIVQEFSAGIWMWEIVAAVDHKDEAALKRMRELNIDPKEVARRLIWANNWGSMSNAMFHADPHPANIVVKENNQLVFVDFGACGSLNRVKREHTREMFACQARRDIQGMVQSSMGLLEPLPPIDVDEFQKELELALTQSMQRIWSKHSAWYERTSAALWMSFFDLTRKYELPVNLDTVRVFRAAMLYDSLALRLHPDLNLYKEYSQFAKDSGAQVRRKMKRALMMRLRKGLRKVDYGVIADVLDTAGRGVFRLKRFLDKPAFNFLKMVEKSVYSVLMVLRVVITVGVLLALASVGMTAYRYFTRGTPLGVLDSLRLIISNVGVQAGIVLLCVLSMRRIVFRLNDRNMDS